MEEKECYKRMFLILLFNLLIKVWNCVTNSGSNPVQSIITLYMLKGPIHLLNTKSLQQTMTNDLNMS